MSVFKRKFDWAVRGNFTSRELLTKREKGSTCLISMKGLLSDWHDMGLQDLPKDRVRDAGIFSLSCTFKKIFIFSFMVGKHMHVLP